MTVDRPQVGRHALQGHVEQQRRAQPLHQRCAFVPLAPSLAPYFECPDHLREAHAAILAMRAGRDTGTPPAHRTRVRAALVAAFPEEGSHAGQHDAGEAVLLAQALRAAFLRHRQSGSALLI